MASKTGVVPLTAFPNASFKEILIVIEAAPSAVTGPALEIVEDAETVPAMNVTVDAVEELGEVTLIVFTSALVVLSVHVEEPAASVAEHGRIKLFDPETEYVGTTPETGVAPFITVIVIVDESALSAM